MNACINENKSRRASTQANRAIVSLSEILLACLCKCVLKISRNEVVRKLDLAAQAFFRHGHFDDVVDGDVQDVGVNLLLSLHVAKEQAYRVVCHFNLALQR